MSPAAKIKPGQKAFNRDIVLHAQPYHWKSLMSWPSVFVLETESYYQFIYLFESEWGLCIEARLADACRTALSLPSAASAFSTVWMPVINLSFKQCENFVIQMYINQCFAQYSISKWTSSDSFLIHTRCGLFFQTILFSHSRICCRGSESSVHCKLEKHENRQNKWKWETTSTPILQLMHSIYTQSNTERYVFCMFQYLVVLCYLFVFLHVFFAVHWTFRDTVNFSLSWSLN